MLDWDKLRVFYVVAQTKNITKAGERLNVSQSAVSRQITALEHSLNTPLFHRRARGLLLTEQGEILLKTVSEFFQKLTITENALMEVSDRPKGLLKVTTTHAFGATWLTQQLKEFAELFPEIAIELILDDAELDLSMGEANIAIRMYPSKNPDLVQRPLVTIHSGIYASNDYLRVHGIPKTLADLSEHKIMVYRDAGLGSVEHYNWLQTEAEKQGVPLTINFTVNNVMAMLRAVKNGMGVAVLPDYIVERARHVSRIVDEVQGVPMDAYMVYPSDMRDSKRIRAFRHFLQRKLAEYTF
ncbi:MAG: LysR family transcriptional regulator [Alphaproteobacteria bacterium]|nr:MAG: LysR family transcriptional regulator [Alphaproteobacteria bacterium]TAF13519.1 MAG: LysR family transcriptional regulator [Alphaproteobacteria bacterium]TAF40556.1 MAG: LysR family transcriptional regulator [Alphaproteobacteria bacterium]TAF76040.1 MAG: LysR family transcriptional regulator [Alphaproteobacteria bacterium]